MYANLQPKNLDVDLGKEYGIQFQRQLDPTSATPVGLVVGDVFSMEVVVNSLGTVLQGFHIEIRFDDSIMRIQGEEDCLVGSDWPDPKNFVCAVNLPGLTDQVVISGQDISTTANSLKSARVEVAKIDFEMIGSGRCKTLVSIILLNSSPSTTQNSCRHSCMI